MKGEIYVCNQPRHSGECDTTLERFYYDHFARKCIAFMYSGCGGILKATRKIFFLIYLQNLSKNRQPKQF